VLDDLGRTGRVWTKADAETTDLETVITNLLTGQYKALVRVIGFIQLPLPMAWSKPWRSSGENRRRSGSRRPSPDSLIPHWRRRFGKVPLMDLIKRVRPITRPLPSPPHRQNSGTVAVMDRVATCAGLGLFDGTKIPDSVL
jgi:hypothetical protein